MGDAGEHQWYWHDMTEIMINGIIYCPSVDNEYCCIGWYIKRLHEIKKILDYNMKTVGCERLKEIMCLGFVLNKSGRCETDPVVIDDEELERLYFKNYTELMDKKESKTLYSVYEYFENKLRYYLFRI